MRPRASRPWRGMNPWKNAFPEDAMSVASEADPTGRQPSGSGRHADSMPFGTLAFVGALGSLITCYGSIAATALFGMDAFGMNPHLQAVVMWGFGVMAIFGLWRDRRVHGRNHPIIVAGAGLTVLLLALYVSYDQRVEILAYVGLVAGALLNQTAMLAGLNETVVEQSEEIRELNRSLEREVKDQVGEIERLNRLKEFLPPSVAELIVSEGGERILESHRRYIACLVCDIRDFTRLSERLEPEEAIAVLREYHDTIGALIAHRNGTIGHRAGDGFMVFFNDPVPCERPVLECTRLAWEIRDVWQAAQAPWERRGYPMGIGVGIAAGYATLGLLGQRGGADYTAIGNVVNLASRLCDLAAAGEILIDERAYLDAEEAVEIGRSTRHELKGISDPVTACEVAAVKDPAAPQAAPADK